MVNSNLVNYIIKIWGFPPNDPTDPLTLQLPFNDPKIFSSKWIVKGLPGII